MHFNHCFVSTAFLFTNLPISRVSSFLFAPVLQLLLVFITGLSIDHYIYVFSLISSCKILGTLELPHDVSNSNQTVVLAAKTLGLNSVAVGENCPRTGKDNISLPESEHLRAREGAKLNILAERFQQGVKYAHQPVSFSRIDDSLRFEEKQLMKQITRTKIFVLFSDSSMSGSLNLSLLSERACGSGWGWGLGEGYQSYTVKCAGLKITGAEKRYNFLWCISSFLNKIGGHICWLHTQ